MIVDGRAIASLVLAEVRASLPEGTVPVVRAITVRPSPATLSYLRIKRERAEEAGMRLEVVKLADDAAEDEIRKSIVAPGADSVIVQLPIPETLDTKRVVAGIPIEQDADVLSAAAYARFDGNEPGALVPPVAGGVWEILMRSQVEVRGKKVVVVGRGQLVGKPCATLLRRNSAEVSVVSRSTENPRELYLQADIIVSGAGKAHLITPDMVQDGAVLIDAGTSGQGGGVAGDIHPDCALKASVFTPVPGGVGPVAVAYLFKNAAALVASRGSLA